MNDTTVQDSRPELLNSIIEHPDVQRLIKQVVQLQIKNERLKEILYKYMQAVMKIAGAIWDTKTQVSLACAIEEMNKDFEQALKE